MKIKNKIILFFITIFITLIISTKVQAASASISASSTNIKVGEKVTITTKINGAAWQINLSGAVSASYSDSTSDAEDTVKKETTTFKPTKKGSYTINLSGNVTGSNDSKATSVKDSVTIKVTEDEQEDSNNNNNNNNTNSVSSDATLKNLGITPNDFSGFKKSVTSYSVTVPNKVDKVTVYAKATDSNAKVSGTGSKSLKVGKNSVSIKVTAEDGKTTKTYTINITRKDKNAETEDENDDNQVSKDATLKDFGITPKQYDFSGFRKTVTNYSTTVSNDTESITIYATATSSKATVEGTGKQELNSDINKFTVKVIAEDKKTTQTYNITVIRGKEDENTEKDSEQNNDKTQSNSLIKDIKISGYSLIPEFKEGVNEYKVNVQKNINELDISTESINKNINVEIAGNSNLKEGDNIITIVAYDEKNDITETYQITATVGDEEINIETYNHEVQQFQSGQKKKNGIAYAVVGLIILLIITFILTRHIIKRHYAYDGEDFLDEDSNEIDNKYSIFNNELDEYDESKKKNKTKNKGKRFKE